MKAVNYSNNVNSSMWNLIQNHTQRDGYLTQVVQEKMISNFMGQSFNFASTFGSINGSMGSFNEERVQESSHRGSPQRSAGGDPPNTAQDGFGPFAAPHIPPTGLTSSSFHASTPPPQAFTIDDVRPGDKMRTSEGEMVTVLFVDAASNTVMVQSSDRATPPVLKQMNELRK